MLIEYGCYSGIEYKAGDGYGNWGVEEDYYGRGYGALHKDTFPFGEGCPFRNAEWGTADIRDIVSYNA